MEHVAHQCICMQYILELSKQLDVDPRACVGSFFSRILIAEVEYKNSFEDELRAFKDRIRKRAAEKIDDAVRQAEEEEKKARLGPGGLDPVEVFESLPEVNGSLACKPNLCNIKNRYYRIALCTSVLISVSKKMLRVTGYYSVTTNNSHDARRGSDISHETMRRQWSVGSRRESQGKGGAERCEGNARSRVMTHFLSTAPYVRYSVYENLSISHLHEYSLHKTKTDALK